MAGIASDSRGGGVTFQRRCILIVAYGHRIGVAGYKHIAQRLIEFDELILAVERHFIAAQLLGQQRHCDHNAVVKDQID